MRQPAISVIIPVRDRARLLRRAARSVLAQSLTDWELIVVDDGSAEDAGAALPRDPRIQVIRHGVSRGVSAARNSGLAAASGDFAAFLDSDDEWSPRKLELQLGELRRRHAPTVHVAGAQLVRGEERRRRPERSTRPGEGIGRFLYVANQFAQSSGILAPLELARAVEFDERLRQYEDHLFLLALEAAGAAIEVSSAPLYRQHLDPRPDRLGLADDPARARAFLERAGPLLRPEERWGFELRCLGAGLAREDPAAALRLAAAGLAAPSAPKGAAAKLLARALRGLARRGGGLLDLRSTRPPARLTPGSRRPSA